MKGNTMRAKGEGTVRKRPDGRWEARFTIGRDPKTGKQIQRSVYGDTQKEVVARLQENLGHYSAAFTLDTYGHVTESMKRESADRMEQFINSVKGKRIF
jgi:hypothetical protein